MTVERIAEDVLASEERLPEFEKAKEFYTKYEVKNILGKWVGFIFTVKYIILTPFEDHL